MNMNTNKTLILMATVLCAASAVRADGWRLTVGPAWRAQMKTEMRGGVSERDYSSLYRELERGEWASHVGEAVERPDPAAGHAGVPADATLWGLGASYTETAVSCDGTDRPSSLGLKAKLGYDFYDNETISVGLDLRFAGYWNMRSSVGASGGSRTVTDWWLFEDGPYPSDPTGDFGFAPAPVFTPGSPADGTLAAVSAGRGRIRADLYQVGLGPTVTWHAFSWLDAYAGVAALANIAALDFEAGASKASETQCRFGVAGEVGLAAYVTENLGLYAEVGYEWVDGFDISAGPLSADVDFSSLIVSVGAAFRF